VKVIIFYAKKHVEVLDHIFEKDQMLFIWMEIKGLFQKLNTSLCLGLFYKIYKA